MKYRHFEEVPVWQDAVDLGADIFKLTEDQAFYRKGDIANQLQRAGLSVSNNIAEGFERGTTAELIQFIYYAKGSAGEVRSICSVMQRLHFLSHLKSEISNLESLAEKISRQLGGWAFSLQESDIKGSRHLTERSRSSHQQKVQAQAFIDKLKQQHQERIAELERKRRIS